MANRGITAATSRRRRPCPPSHLTAAHRPASAGPLLAVPGTERPRTPPDLGRAHGRRRHRGDARGQPTHRATTASWFAGSRTVGARLPPNAITRGRSLHVCRQLVAVGAPAAGRAAAVPGPAGRRSTLEASAARHPRNQHHRRQGRADRQRARRHRPEPRPREGGRGSSTAPQLLDPLSNFNQ